jgi:nicotinamide-nucleotide amidase
MLQDKSVIILVVSREILEGAVLDRNAAFICNRVDDLGYRVRTVQVVDRVENEITSAIRWALEQKPRFVLVTGGLGPSFDDNSRACAAKATGLPLREDDKAMEYVQNSYQRLFARGVVEDPAMNEDRRRMAQIPAGAECFENPIGTGPAVRLDAGETTLFLLPGVPAEMQRLFQLFVSPALSAMAPDVIRQHRTVDYHGTDESVLSHVIREIAREYPEVSFRTRLGGPSDEKMIRIELVADHPDTNKLDDILQTAERELRKRIGGPTRRPNDAGRVHE